MNISEAKQILLACRVGTDDVRETDVAEALEEVRRVPELHEWWIEQQQFHAATADAFRGARVPEGLRDRLLAHARIVPVSFWRRPVVLGAAAALVLLLGAAALYLKEPRQDTLAIFRSRMVSSVVRQYSMSITTNDMALVRQHLAARNAPADYELSKKMSGLPVIGAGVLSWQDRRVGMVCLDSQKKGMLFLFIVDASSVVGSPVQPEFKPIGSFATVSWTSGNRTYVLAGNMNQSELEEFL